MKTPILNNGFIKRTRQFNYENIYLYKCDYETSLYENKLFNIFEIYFPTELHRSVKKRQSEFLAGRYVTQQALRMTGLFLDKIPNIGIGQHRNPLWPIGLAGSITHTSNTAICATIKKTAGKINFIGIDLEDYLSTDVASDLESSIHTQEEKKICSQIGMPDNKITTLIFSAKESIFKAAYPYIEKYFGFESAKVIGIDIEKRIIKLKLAHDIALATNLKEEINSYFYLGKNSVFTLVHHDYLALEQMKYLS